MFWASAPSPIVGRDINDVADQLIARHGKPD
jgi:hypothetical protein